MKSSPLNGPARYWRVMKDLTKSKGAFTLADIDGATSGVKTSTVKDYTRRLVKQGDVVLIEAVNVNRGGVVNRYRVAHYASRAPSLKRPDYTGRKGAIQRNLWNAMRTLPRFTIAELAIAASTEETPIKVATARAYVLALQTGGAVLAITPYAKARAGATGARPGVYRLKPSANRGPKPLQIERSKGVTRVFDPNRDRYLGEAVKEVA